MKFDYNRVLIVGCGGAGKSTFARAMSEKTKLPTVHLDKLWWLPDWQERDETEFDVLLMRELQKPNWIIDGNYFRTLELRLKYADFVVMLDISPDECLANVCERVQKYKGKTRPDMTDGCEERIDDDFRNWILSFNKDVRGKMIETIKVSGKPFELFDTRESAYAWLNSFENRISC